MAQTSALSRIKSIFRTPVQEKTQLTSPVLNYGIQQKELNPYYGVVGGAHYATTGMPWLSADARKAVLTEWFWQPIRGQPRRVDTNELRKYSNTIWVQSIVMTVLNQISSIPWDIVPKKGKEQADLKEQIKTATEFLETPNKNEESLHDIIRAWIKDVLEIDAGVLVKVFTPDSYDFENLEPRSGAPLLKPLVCPYCSGEGEGEIKHFKERARKALESITKAEALPEKYVKKFSNDTGKKSQKTYYLTKQNYEPIKTKLRQVVSYNSPNEANVMNYPTQTSMKCPYCNGTKEGRRLQEIYARDGSSFLKDADRTGWTYGYWQYSYAIPAHPMWFNRDEIIYFNQTTRSMSVYGYSAVQSSLEIIKSLEYSVKHNMSLFLDGAVPDGVISTEDMSNEEMKRMKTSWENELKGQPHKVIFINKKTNFVPFAFNNRDMQYLEGQKASWLQVIANFNMTPTDLGITQDVNRSSASQQTELTRRKSIRPILKKIENIINKQIMPELRVEDVQFRFIIDDPVEERKAAELAEIYLRNGMKTVNELRIAKGEAPVKWGDENPKESMMSMNEQRGEATGRTSEVTEERPAENEAQRREKAGYMNAQVPFITATQNLTGDTPYPSNQRHINSIQPYKDMSQTCPGCGYETLETLQAQNGGINEPWYHCIRCDREYTKEKLTTATQEQERIHNQLNQVARRATEYTETQGYPKKKLISILSLKNKNKSEEKLFELGMDQGSATKLIKNSKDVVVQLTKEIRKDDLLKKGALLIENFDDFVSIVEANKNRATFNQMKRYVEETKSKFVFRYADKYYRYVCDVPKSSIKNIDEFRSRYVTTATKATEVKRKITIEG